MKNVVLSIPLALAATLAVFASAFAQSNKEAGPDSAAVAPRQRIQDASQQDKAAARAKRRAEGAGIAKSHPVGDAAPDSMGARKAATPEERRAARTERRSEGAATAKSHPVGDAAPSSMGARKSATPEERREARAERRALASEALQKGQIPSGEK